jgi:hypothetical protein
VAALTPSRRGIAAGRGEIRAFSVPRCRGRNGQGGGPLRRANGVRPSRGAPRFHPLPSQGDRGRRPLPCAPPIRLPLRQTFRRHRGGRNLPAAFDGGNGRDSPGSRGRRYVGIASPPGPRQTLRRQRVSESGGVQSLSRRQPLIDSAPTSAGCSRWSASAVSPSGPAQPRGRGSVPGAFSGPRLSVGRGGLGPGRAAGISPASPWGPVGPLRLNGKELSRPYRRNTFAGQVSIYGKRHVLL